jgi:hypothetical protein
VEVRGIFSYSLSQILPCICSETDVGDSDKGNCLYTRFVEGKTLRAVDHQRIVKKLSSFRAPGHSSDGTRVGLPVYVVLVMSGRWHSCFWGSRGVCVMDAEFQVKYTSVSLQ